MKVNVRVPFKSFDGQMVEAGEQDLSDRAIEHGKRCGAVDDIPVREPKKKPKKTPVNKSLDVDQNK